MRPGNPNGRYLDSSEVMVAVIRRGTKLSAALSEAGIKPQTYRACTYGVTTIDLSKIENLASILLVKPDDIIAKERPNGPQNRSETNAS